ncbi:hypothetical protein HDU85_006608 [Gaertneriomyces sp. JEL0708]|nr:hypothetical protein HDU85_006608 [Gaertneriomyces sp. JEL0708]
MFARSALRAVAPKRMLRGGDHQVGAWGPMNFAGNNWKSEGALPFVTSSRGRFLVTFWSIALLGLAVPFLNTEWKLAPARAEKRRKDAASA